MNLEICQRCLKSTDGIHTCKPTDLVRKMEQRIQELEAVIRSHSIPVKTATGGEAHYCMGDVERDAARYRHVRAKPEMLLHLSNKDFDAAIDAAMKEQS